MMPWPARMMGRLAVFSISMARSNSAWSCLLRVFGDVDKDWTGTSAFGDQEGFAESARNVLCFRDHHVVLGDGHGNACDVDLLKRVGPQDFATDLAGYANDRRRVQHGRGDAGNHVRSARTRCGHGDADATAGAGVAI